MTITTSQLTTTPQLTGASQPTAAAPRLVWSEADTNLLVADAGGVFGGSIDSDTGRHVARDPYGRERGTFDTIADAKRHLETFLAHPAMTRYLRQATHTAG